MYYVLAEGDAIVSGCSSSVRCTLATLAAPTASPQMDFLICVAPAHLICAVLSVRAFLAVSSKLAQGNMDQPSNRASPSTVYCFTVH